MAVAALERNKYFFGKLMDVVQFEKEQNYFRRQHALLNRLALGSGVLCGLNVTQDPDVQDHIRVEAGVAIDRQGQFIIVPMPVTVNPAQLTDDQGTPTGNPIESGTVLIALAYAEMCADPVAVFVNDCDTPGQCAASTIREDFRVLVRRPEAPPPAPIGCPFPNLPIGAPTDLHAVLSAYVSGACPDPPADTSIPLARVNVPDLTTIDTASDRPLVYSNLLLWQMLVCLGMGTAAGRILRYVSGDAQSARANQSLSSPVVVEVVNGQGHPVSGVVVQFQPDAGGAVSSASVMTDAQGQAGTTWTLGPRIGEQHVTAAAAGSPLTVTFRATALEARV